LSAWTWHLIRKLVWRLIQKLVLIMKTIEDDLLRWLYIPVVPCNINLTQLWCPNVVQIGFHCIGVWYIALHVSKFRLHIVTTHINCIYIYYGPAES
jgi:hypothetical protein